MTEQYDASASTPSHDNSVPDSSVPDNSVSDISATDPAPAAAHRKRRVLRWFGWSSAGLGVLALFGLAVYLIDVTSKWEDRVGELTVISADLGQQAANARVAQAEAEVRMEAAQAELTNATTRISDLANEEAHANDRESVLIDYAEAMISCADSRQELIDVLTDSRLYFPGKTNYQVEREVTAYCDGVSSDFKTFKKELDK